ncbi:uncharacterized protein DUF2786 [Humibacillus xanthopallidus]|uniref:Uncharacterized protein DUF2786 n=1 Tax=Humibacillus xanthopallidus TaxID=412689 RepID=A0A543PP51_9MICO|nr:DUF2786 domain-containing protein [Humibacillus xanthopallidus]TQN45862.1 uncharacterized protein DUF2786 [Humibacillus xanthopallidus]
MAVGALISQALHALDVGVGDHLDDAAVTLAGRCASPTTQRDVVTILLDSLTAATTVAWERGWQPSDVHRLAGRRLGVAEQAFAVDVMSHELSRYAPATVDRRWWAQLRELGGTVWWEGSSTLLDAHRDKGTDWFTLMSRALTVLHLVARLPVLELLTPVPGTVVAAPSPAGGGDDRPVVDERILSKVRMLLAKAESTTFEAEAETFTAGAQALMARHSIDAALLAATAAAGRLGPSAPEGRRIGIDNPYDGPKAMLLNAVASANRCRMVWSRELGFGTVVGFESDLEGVEVLFTSLLVQATRTLTSAGSRTDRHGGSRTRAFRQSFLTAYASRIGERLRAVTAAEEVAASETARSSGRELVPLLEARAEEVDDAVSTWFPELQTHSVGAVRDAEGWHSGRAAADRAELGAGPTITP